MGVEAVRIRRSGVDELLDHGNREDVHAALDRSYPVQHRRDAGGRVRRRVHRLRRRHAVRVQCGRVDALLGKRHREDVHATLDLCSRWGRVFVAGRSERCRLLLRGWRDVRVRRGRIAELLSLRHGEKVLSALERCHRLQQRGIACRRQRSPVHQRPWQREDLRLLTVTSAW